MFGFIKKAIEHRRKKIAEREKKRDALDEYFVFAHDAFEFLILLEDCGHLPAGCKVTKKDFLSFETEFDYDGFHVVIGWFCNVNDKWLKKRHPDKNFDHVNTIDIRRSSLLLCWEDIKSVWSIIKDKLEKDMSEGKSEKEIQNDVNKYINGGGNGADDACRENPKDIAQWIQQKANN